MKEGVGEDGAMYTNDSRFCRAPNATSRWQILDGAVRLFVQELARSDAEEKVALATYSSDLGSSGYCGTSRTAATLDCTLDTDLTRVTTAMDRLTTTVWNGNTHIEAGMRTGLARTRGGTSRIGARTGGGWRGRWS